eukprot:TCONS_00029844-protein
MATQGQGMRNRRNENQPPNIRNYTSETYKSSNKNKSSFGYGIPNFVGIVFFLISLYYAVFLTENFLPTPKPFSSSKEEFSAERAATHLFDITKLGPRTAGSYENDVSAVRVILKALKQIKLMANEAYDVDIDVQTETGDSFAFVRSGIINIGYTITYNNITNVVVKVSKKASVSSSYILINAHFDTVPNTEGASDDTVSCAVMLETLRTILQTNPDQINHGFIFLLNGAEEGPLAGSHAFIKHHKWKDLAKVVINLEAAGSGGREFVFQTGPEHPWILETYAKAAKYPYTSVVAQEIFQSGVIPSDTDFRVFVQYGGLVGIDFAFINNGYVYHTKYDSAKAIPNGSIQRAGENVLGIIKAMSMSPYLENPGEYKHGNTVFFDVLGSFIIHYPKRMQLLMNNITCIVVLLFFIQRLVRFKFSSAKEHVGIRHSTDQMSIGSTLLAMIIIISSWVAAIVTAFTVAHLLVKLNVLNTWYSSPKFTIFLYGLPALFGMLLTHYIGNVIMRKVSNPSIPSFVYGHLLSHSLLLFIMNQYEIMSSFLLWFWIVSPLFFVAIGYDAVPFLPEKKEMGIFCLHILGSAFPVMLTIYHGEVFYAFFGPLLGRTGTQLPGDYVMAVLSALMVFVCCSYFMNIYQHANNMRRFLVFIGIISLVPILYVVMGKMQPYSAKDPITPKRLFQVHMQRTFYGPDSQLLKEDSGIWVQPLDYIGIQPIINIPFYKDMRSHKCDGAYCGLPYYYAMRKIIQEPYYLPGPKLDNTSPLTTSIYRKEMISPTITRFYFDFYVPAYGNIYLTPRDGVRLSDWSMYKTSDGHIYAMDDYMGEGKQAHYVLYSSGYYSTSWKFWLDLEKLDDTGTVNELADLGITRHYFPGKKSRFLYMSQKALPDWICDNSWMANYDHFTLA